MTPDASFWTNLLAWTAGEIMGLSLLAALAHGLVRSASGRKIIWRTALVVALLALAAESSGLVATTGQWLKKQWAPTTTVARMATVNLNPDPAPAVEDSTTPPPPFALPASRPAETVAVWWPALVWLGGLGLVLGYHGIGGLLMIRLKRRLRPVTDARLVARMAMTAGKLGVTPSVQLFESVHAPGPFTFGCWRPAICLPTGFTSDYTPIQQDAILAHELEHIAGRDFLWQRVGMLLVVLLWWHPAAWWMRHQLATASEQAADEASLLVDHGPDALAESLVVLGRKMSHAWQPVLLGVEGASFRSGLARRVQRLWTLRDRQFSRSRRRYMVVAIVGGMFALGGLALFATILPREATANGLANRSLIAVATEALAPPALPQSAASRQTHAEVPAATLPALKRPGQPGPTEPQQILIEMRLCDVPSEDGKPPDFDKLLGLTLTNAVGEARAIPGSATNAEANTLIGILTDQAFRQVIGKLEKQKGVDILSAPKITTLSGRQAQVKVVDIKSVVTLLQSNSTTITAGKTNLMSKPSLPWSPVTEPFELGPTVDVVPSVLAGGEHILLTVIPSVREFLGYDGVVGSDYEKQVSNEAVTKSRNAAHKATDELPESISAPLPRFRVRQALCKASVPDGQTLVIAGGSIVDEVINQGVPEVHPPKTKPKKGLLLFVTPRLIDANGNPLAR